MYVPEFTHFVFLWAYQLGQNSLKNRCNFFLAFLQPSYRPKNHFQLFYKAFWNQMIAKIKFQKGPKIKIVDHCMPTASILI